MDIQNFENLLSENKIGEAKKLLEDYLKQEPTAAEKGTVYTALASAYVKAKNQINQQYLAELESILQLLKSAGKVEKKIDDAGELSNLRSSIKNS